MNQTNRVRVSLYRGGKRSKSVFRLLDVNLNRAREGIRVVEDTVRLIGNDLSRYRALRDLRHRLDRTARPLYGSLVLARDVNRDVGRNARAQRFSSIDSVLSANFRRAEESLRVLEEYSRLLDDSLTGEFQAIRFHLYQLEKKVYAGKT